MLIRESTAEDSRGISDLHESAFGPTEGPLIARLVVALFADETAEPLLSLVAEEGEQIVGSIIYSRIRIEGHEESLAHILAPLAVEEGRRGKGIGSALISTGLGLLAERGSELVLVLGDPRYYSRAGFETARGLLPPHELDHPEAWMAQELRAGVLEHVTGPVHCAVSLHPPEYW